MRNIFQFCLNIRCLVMIRAKFNTKCMSTIMSIGFCPNCNQTADRLAKLKKNFSFLQRKNIVSFGNIYLADKGKFLKKG